MEPAWALARALWGSLHLGSGGQWRTVRPPCVLQVLIPPNVYAQVFMMFHLHDKRPPLRLPHELEGFSAVLTGCWLSDPALRMPMLEVVQAITSLPRNQVALSEVV